MPSSIRCRRHGETPDLNCCLTGKTTGISNPRTVFLWASDGHSADDIDDELPEIERHRAFDAR
jgi:hypothetical protein